MIRFRCKNCNQKISVPESHAGKNGKCPQCKNVVVVPKAENSSSPPSQNNSKTRPKFSDSDLLLLDVPQHDKPAERPATQEDRPDNTSEGLRQLQEKVAAEADQTELAGKRKFPWLIDIFLYPTSTSGLIILGLVVGVPFLLRALVKLFGAFSLVFPPMLILLALFAVIRIMVEVVFVFYMYWYICQCVRDSARGGTRAPETIAITPALGELLWKFVQIVCCLAFFSLPAVVYFLRTGESDITFRVLLGCGIFFFPMGLLSVLMFESLRGLNPILIISSIFSAFLPYCGLIIFYCVISGLFSLAVSALSQHWYLHYLIMFVSFYMALVEAHLLGRFAWRYREKLNWESLGN